MLARKLLYIQVRLQMSATFFDSWMCAHAESEIYMALKHFDNTLMIKCKVKKIAFENTFSYENVSEKDIESLALAKSKIIFQDKLGLIAKKRKCSVNDVVAEYAAKSVIDMNEFVKDYALQLSREEGVSSFDKTIQAVKAGKYTAEQLAELAAALNIKK